MMVVEIALLQKPAPTFSPLKTMLHCLRNIFINLAQVIFFLSHKFDPSVNINNDEQQNKNYSTTVKTPVNKPG